MHNLPPYFLSGGWQMGIFSLVKQTPISGGQIINHPYIYDDGVYNSTTLKPLQYG
jgi:hypothetical protein